MSGYLKKPKRTKSEKQERSLAKRLGGRTTPGSGSGSMKGDVQTYSRAPRNPLELPVDAMVEAKTTSKTQYTLKLRDLQKLEREAEARGKRPVFVVRINDDSPVMLFESEYAIIPMSHFEELTKHLREDD